LIGLRQGYGPTWGNRPNHFNHTQNPKITGVHFGNLSVMIRVDQWLTIPEFLAAKDRKG
jgi:hypothetical protein